MFGLGIEPGEAQVISEYLKFFLSELFKARLDKQKEQGFQKKPATNEEKEEAPF